MLSDLRDVVERFVFHNVERWDDETTDEDALDSVQELLNAVGFKATAGCWSLFGGWIYPCTGPDGEAATSWLEEITASLPSTVFFNPRSIHHYDVVGHILVKIKERSG